LTETELRTIDKASLTATAEKPSAESLAIAVVAKNQPLVAEVELKPLAIPRQLPLPRGAELAEPAVGFWGRHRLFIMTVVLPMTIGAIFLLLVATPRYSSTASFVVKSTKDQSTLSSLAQDAIGTPFISAETYAVSAYLTSRDIVDRLAENDNLRAILSRPEGDFVFRYPTFWLPNNNEFLYQRFQWMATAYVDDTTGISTIEMNAFTAEDAQILAQAALGYAEALVNRMNERMYQDQLASTEHFVAEAQKDVDAIEAELTAFRNVSGSVDPNLVAQSKLKVIQGLSAQLAQVEATIAQQVVLAPTSPTLHALRAQAQSYGDEIEKRKLEIAGASGSEAIKLQTYDQLTLRRSIAAAALSDAVIQRDQARQAAEQQHLYIQVIAQPNIARDYARYPRTSLDLLALLAICLAVFQVLRKLRDFAAEHHP
jgi:capsular polysaccharide transport system permease protein